MPNNDLILIDRRPLIEYFEGLARSLANARRFSTADAIQGAAEKLRAAPTVDAEPVRRGSWGERRITGYDGLHAVYTRPCSECSHEARFSTNYCHNCGAKMDA